MVAPHHEARPPAWRNRLYDLSQSRPLSTLQPRRLGSGPRSVNDAGDNQTPRMPGSSTKHVGGDRPSGVYTKCGYCL
jgi:hypothetical protein